MNLMIYGCGSKRQLLEDFLQNQVWIRFPSILVRGYHSGLMPKTILTDIVDYIRQEIDKNPRQTAASRKWSNTTEILEYIKRKML